MQEGQLDLAKGAVLNETCLCKNYMPVYRPENRHARFLNKLPLWLGMRLQGALTMDLSRILLPLRLEAASIKKPFRAECASDVFMRRRSSLPCLSDLVGPVRAAASGDGAPASSASLRQSGNVRLTC